jgi:hypothetical protein
MRFALHLLFGLGLLLGASLASGQSNLGTLLDAGATQLSTEDFRRELMGRHISGLAVNGQNIQVVYAESGEIRGVGRNRVGTSFEILGTYTMDGSARICATMQLGSVSLAPRCQYWYRLDRKYFLSDSDSDRSARVLERTAAQ